MQARTDTHTHTLSLSRTHLLQLVSDFGQADYLDSPLLHGSSGGCGQKSLGEFPNELTCQGLPPGRLLQGAEIN